MPLKKSVHIMTLRSSHTNKIGVKLATHRQQDQQVRDALQDNVDTLKVKVDGLTLAKYLVEIADSVSCLTRFMNLINIGVPVPLSEQLRTTSHVPASDWLLGIGSLERPFVALSAAAFLRDPAHTCYMCVGHRSELELVQVVEPELYKHAKALLAALLQQDTDIAKVSFERYAVALRDWRKRCKQLMKMSSSAVWEVHQHHKFYKIYNIFKGIMENNH